ncbi:MAG: murein L,D-transpeptidase catalytic domain family protein [Thermoanaerobaculia bacterium]
MNRRWIAILAIAAAAALFPALSEAKSLAHPCGTAASPALTGVLLKQAPDLRPEVLALALGARSCASERGLARRGDLLTVIDYSIASTEPRLWTFDLSSRKLLFREHVAHGVNSGGNRPTKFSNTNGSRQTSLGLFVAEETYYGANGYSMRMRGLEKGVNHLARERAIVMHGAPYVNPAAARKQGRLGRSWGCPAVRTEVARKMIDTLKNGSLIFAYYPDMKWLASSAFLDRSGKSGGSAVTTMAAAR